MNDKKKFLDYSKVLKDNLLNVVKYALRQAAHYGLSDNHHFYITFDTQNEKNKIPKYLKEEYPENMIIVLENEYWNLEVTDEYFTVALKFKGKIEKLKIFNDSIISFVDPSVSFKLDLASKMSKKAKYIKNKKDNTQRNTENNVIIFKPNKNK